mmetsp:Transcript_8389/g.22083  ORF Transcript_8389/g.22083 Transcript_8389/m.22083 type:complete len:375 (+) Transcript_8389:387-1511(+)|eukprot:CAMPEP_0185832076 /NCGR_PEP_ID=MMETSP1353-20130828/1873_1 /TAXON_ID=1077150 /ORGANISM="Erythrolobus australicus, Strain CCMP3124" /LENGTH=374 /DNA_ID=CAMNT_0028530215 /DNA_START=380 /DNA_END=1504 /DNA_ORIENTATION=-
MQQRSARMDIGDTASGLQHVLAAGNSCGLQNVQQQQPPTPPSPTSPPSPPSLPSSLESRSCSLLSLPDELLFKCVQSMPAEDLAAMERVNRELHSAMLRDTACWRQCVAQRYEALSSEALLARAADLAGGWKRLFAELEKKRKENKRWITACQSLVDAYIEAVVNFGDVQNGTARSNAEGGNIVVLMDGSSSISDEDFDIMKSFCAQLLRKAHAQTQVCVLQFNQTVVTEIALAQLDVAKHTATVSDLHQIMGSTDIPIALRNAQYVLRDANAESSKRAVLLISDGQVRESENEALRNMVDVLCEEMHAVFSAVGIGRDVDEKVLSELVHYADKKTAAGNNNHKEHEASHASHQRGAYFTLRKWREYRPPYNVP